MDNRQKNDSSGAYNVSSKKGLIAFLRFSITPVLGGFFISIIVAMILSMFVEPSEGMSYIATFSLMICGILLYKNSIRAQNIYLELFQKTYKPKTPVYTSEESPVYTTHMNRDIWFIWKVIWTPQSNPNVENSRLVLTKRINTLVLFMTFLVPIWIICTHLGLP